MISNYCLVNCLKRVSIYTSVDNLRHGLDALFDIFLTGIVLSLFHATCRPELMLLNRDIGPGQLF
jgi:hypothetical protein